MVRYLANGTVFGKSYMVNGTVCDQFCYNQFTACHAALSKQNKHAQATISCSHDQGTDAARVHVHTSFSRYVGGSKLQLDQSFRLQIFIHGSESLCQKLIPNKTNFGLLNLECNCGLYSTHLFKKTPILAHHKESVLVRHACAFSVAKSRACLFLQINNLTQVKILRYTNIFFCSLSNLPEFTLNYLPGRMCFKYIITLKACTTVRCSETDST